MAVDYQGLYEQAADKCTELEAVLAVLRKGERLLGLRGAPFPNSGFEWLVYLQYKVKSQKERIKAFMTGEQYVKMTSEFEVAIAGKDREIKKLKEELASANAQVVTVRKYWSEIFDDLEKETAKALAGKERELKEMEKRALRAEKQRDDKCDKITELYRDLYEARAGLEEEQGKNLKLTAQINRDYENSSIPSSMKPNRKKITNNREKTGKKPGGQPGHEGHARRRLEPTRTISIPAPEEYANSDMYAPTGELATRQMINIKVDVIVDEYSTPVFRHIITGQRVHADFPDSLANEVNYGGSVKAFPFMLGSRYNVPIDKAGDFLSELTQGRLNISHGMICGLNSEFSSKTEQWQRKAFADMQLAPVINTDFTSANVNGKKVNVLVCTDGRNVLYFPRMNKGFAGILGSVVEDYLGILVHDHDLTFYSYGSKHQECLDHVLRYLKDSIQNEGHLTWNGKMRELIRGMIHFRKRLDADDLRDPNEIAPETVKRLVSRYDEILDLAKKEYEYEPPADYYKDGYNLYKRLAKYKDSHLLFLYDRRVPHSNSISERLLRIYKRKQHQAMAFRSFGGLGHLCDALGVIASLREQGKNLYETASAVFDMPSKGSKKHPA